MRSWLTYIFLLMATCGAVLTSCSNVLDEEGIATCDDRAPVRLTISFGDSSPMSRDVDAGSDGTVPGLDYTTDLQKAMYADDVYLLVFDATTDLLKYQVKDLILGEASKDTYNTRTLSGYMLRTATNETVKLVVLANLTQNNITVTLEDNTSLSLNSKANVQTFIDKMIGKSQTAIYEKLIYNYDGTTTPWTLTGDNARRIPMWGITAATQVPSTGTSLDCYLYRAVAKVQIWVNMKKGIAGTTDPNSTNDDFKITKITVQKANSKGYCVSQAAFDNNSTHYVGIDAKPYAAPFVPGYASQTVVYEVSDSDSNEDRYNDAREAYSDMIYLPEQVNLDANGNELSNAVTIEVTYNYNGETGKVGTIHFTEDIIRNHSYIFNITSVGAKLGLTCVVQDWEKESETWDFTDNVTVADNGHLTWNNLQPDEKGTVIIPNTLEYTCTFNLLTPTDGTWQASLIPAGGQPDAFEFVGANSGTIGENGTGVVTLTIKAKYSKVYNENNAAKLRIFVRTKDGRTLVTNLTGNQSFSEYTLVQNVNAKN